MLLFSGRLCRGVAGVCRFDLGSRVAPRSIRYFSDNHDHGSDDNESLVYPKASSSHHSSLSTFIDYVKRSGLDEKSTVYRGTHYEYTVADSLARYGFYLRRIGGASDYGTDLLGTWTLPSTSLTIKVLVQCKAGERVGPNYVREMEGAFAGAPVGWRGTRVMGLVVTEKPATKGIRDSLARSRWPMGYIACSKKGSVHQMLWNRRAQDEGLEGFGVVARHGANLDETELVLVKDGKTLPFTGDSME